MRKLFILAAVLLALNSSTVVAQTDLGTIMLVNGDVDGDNAVTTSDLSILLKNMDQTATSGDLDGDGKVTNADLGIVLKNIDMQGD